jgi:hypothetical protein
MTKTKDIINKGKTNWTIRAITSIPFGAKYAPSKTIEKVKTMAGVPDNRAKDKNPVASRITRTFKRHRNRMYDEAKTLPNALPNTTPLYWINVSLGNRWPNWHATHTARVPTPIGKNTGTIQADCLACWARVDGNNTIPVHTIIKNMSIAICVPEIFSWFISFPLPRPA